MDLTRSDVGVTPPADRLSGPDVVRAVALIGVVVMNYHGYLLLRGPGSGGVGDDWWNRLFDPFGGPLSTRFAATFVLVAGVGITLISERARSSPAEVTATRWRLARRGLLLYVVGLLLEEIWPGTIIPFYGVMFILAAAMITWRTAWIAVAGLIAAIAGAGVRSWRFERALDGASTSWLTDPGPDSIRRYVFDVFVNGTHPLLPWFAFLCAGMILGRVLRTDWWRVVVAGVGITLVAVATILSSGWSGVSSPDRLDVLVSLDPYDRGLAYVASALGTALVAYAAIDGLASRWPAATDPLRRAGQLTLTLYLAHIFVFNVVVDWLGWVRFGGLDVALAFAGAFWIVAIVAAVAWQRRFGRGPAERVYRGFGG